MAILPILLPYLPIDTFVRIMMTRYEPGLTLQGMFSDIQSKIQTMKPCYSFLLDSELNTRCNIPLFALSQCIDRTNRKQDPAGR